jgi:hypothetical protein
VLYLRLVGSLLLHPKKALTELKANEARLRLAVTSLLVHSAFAGAKQLYFHLRQVPVVPEPFLRIPTESGWLYSAIFQVPVDFAQAILFAGIVTLLAGLFGGKGSFKGQFSLFAFGFVPPVLFLIVGTFALSALGLGGTLVWWAYFVGVMLWDLVFIYLTVRVEQEVSVPAGMFCTLAGFASSLGLSLTYIR